MEIQPPAVHLFKANWLPAVMKVQMTASSDIDGADAKYSPGGVGMWDRLPGGITSSSAMRSVNTLGGFPAFGGILRRRGVNDLYWLRFLGTGCYCNRSVGSETN